MSLKTLKGLLCKIRLLWLSPDPFSLRHPKKVKDFLYVLQGVRKNFHQRVLLFKRVMILSTIWEHGFSCWNIHLKFVNWFFVNPLSPSNCTDTQNTDLDRWNSLFSTVIISFWCWRSWANYHRCLLSLLWNFDITQKPVR